jgi:hypothetical protein
MHGKMMRNLYVWTAAWALAGVAAAQSTAETEFQRGYYLQTHARELEKAAAAFEAVIAAPDAPESMRVEARQRLVQVREDIASDDLARLMPPDAIVYAEIDTPGEHVARLAKMMNLTRQAAQPTPQAGAPATPLGGGMFFPEDFTISPALLDAVRSFRGAAVALTSIPQRGDPGGVAVVNPGDAEIIRGMLETLVQFCEPAEPIEGFRTYRIEGGKAWLTVTARLFIAASTREQVAGVVARLKDPAVESLASRDELKRLHNDRRNALFFAYVDGPLAAKELKRHLKGEEERIANVLLDLEHLRSISAVARTTSEGLELQARMELLDGHHNLAYGLIRTAPFSRDSLAHVPRGVAAVAVLGLNPPVEARTAAAAESPTPVLSAMDIGRELFANLREVAVFVGPGEAGKIPEFGLVLVAQDPAKSRALWKQLLALPALLAPGAGGLEDLTIEGHAATGFQFPDTPPVVLVEGREKTILIGTRGAVTAAIKTTDEQDAVSRDEAFKGMLGQLTPNSSKAVMIHVGRLAAMGAKLAHGHDARHLMLISSVLGDLSAIAVTDEQPTALTVRARFTGLPDLPRAIRTFSRLHHPEGQAGVRPGQNGSVTRRN